MLVVIQAMTNMEAINMLGVRQVNRNCIALQQVCLTIDHLTLAAHFFASCNLGPSREFY